MGGPPCQGFSQKGKRLGLNDERNFLFRNFMDWISLIRPQVFLLENVPNILTAANGDFLKEIKLFFNDFGYSLDYKVLNASSYGVPQNRRRAFFVGSLGKKRYEFPNKVQDKISIVDAIGDLPILKSGEGQDYFDYGCKPKNEYQRKMRLGSKGIWNHVATNHSRKALERLKMIPSLGGKSDLPKEHRTKSIYILFHHMGQGIDTDSGKPWYMLRKAFCV